MVVGQEAFTGDGDGQFALSHGLWKRRLNLNLIGSWQTMWITFLVSAKVPYSGWSGYDVGNWRSEPAFAFGLGSSSGGISKGWTDNLGTPAQWMGGFSAYVASTNSRIYTDGSKEWFQTPVWSAGAKNGTEFHISGGNTTYLCVDGDRRSVLYVIIKKGNPTNWELATGGPSASAADVTKQDCIDWLNGYSTSLDFAFNRPANHAYVIPASVGVDMEPTIYGELDTIFFAVGKGGLGIKLHAVYGKVHSTVV